MGAWAVCRLLCIKHLQSPFKLRQRKMNTVQALHHHGALLLHNGFEHYNKTLNFPWEDAAMLHVLHSVAKLSHLDAFRGNLDKPWKLIECNLPMLPGHNCVPAISLSSLCIMEHARDNSISKNSIPIWDFFTSIISSWPLITSFLNSSSWSVRCCVRP